MAHTPAELDTITTLFCKFLNLKKDHKYEKGSFIENRKAKLLWSRFICKLSKYKLKSKKCLWSHYTSPHSECKPKGQHKSIENRGFNKVYKIMFKLLFLENMYSIVL